MNIFKHQHPQDLISRLFILEYMREVGADVLYTKANKHQAEKYFYKFTDDENTEHIDINYEYCTFIATLHEIEVFMGQFLAEIEEVEAKRSKIYQAAREQMIEEEAAQPVDINVMDLAQTEINKNNSGGIILN